MESDLVPSRIPASVLMERRLASNGRWQQYQWECTGVVCGQEVEDRDAGCTLVGDDGEVARFVWSGLSLLLDKDSCESYWYNLQSDEPYLFVICSLDEATEDESMAVTPVAVSASQDEANAHMESEDLVFSVPMPVQAIEWLERYVVANYDPVIKKKRKRRDWAKESEEHAKRRGTVGRLH